MGPLVNAVHRDSWSKGKIVSQKAPIKHKGIWALRVRRQVGYGVRQLTSSP
jgi:hypothetical protein